MKKKVQLVLGSGGARGIAHIGVIEQLLKNGYEIVDVVGCSMGAVVGGMYCSGHLEAYTEWLLKQTKTDVYRMFDLSFSMQGLVKGERIFSVLQQMTGEQLIENLPIPFSAIATDILSRTEICFDKGDLYKALRASTGIPGVFTPIADGNSLYVDGGVLNPLPVDMVKRRDDAIIVAVSLNGAFENEVAVAVDVPETPLEPGDPDMLTRLKNYFNIGNKNTTKEGVAPVIPTFSMFELFSTSYDASLDRMVEQTLKMYPADVVIEIPRNVCSVFEFYRAAELIDIGKKAYEKAMNKKEVV
jgi:NTE family protein